MKTELICSLTEHFEAHAQQANSGVEFWLARDLQHLLGCAKWENFIKVVNKARGASAAIAAARVRATAA
jgi:DNA-damage-inducible protein D